MDNLNEKIFEVYTNHIKNHSESNPTATQMPLLQRTVLHCRWNSYNHSAYLHMHPVLKTDNNWYSAPSKEHIQEPLYDADNLI